MRYFKLICLVFISLVVICACDLFTQPETYYDVRYKVFASGDTTYISYFDQSADSHNLTIVHDERHEHWEVQFKAKEDANLGIWATTEGEYLGGIPSTVSVSVYIFVGKGPAVSVDYKDGSHETCFDTIQTCILTASTTLRI